MPCGACSSQQGRHQAAVRRTQANWLNDILSSTLLPVLAVVGPPTSWPPQGLLFGSPSLMATCERSLMGEPQNSEKIVR